MALDDVVLNFNPATLMLLNVVVGMIMLGVALDMRIEDFRMVLRAPKAVAIGLLAQFLLLPAVTTAIVVLLDPAPSIALGMILVASCPPGNLSNFLTHLARGGTALSVSMSAVSTVGALVMTPVNLSFWASLHDPAKSLLKVVALDPVEVAMSIMLLIGIPLGIGLTLVEKYPRIADRIRKPVQKISHVLVTLFIVGALIANLPLLQHIGVVAVFVALQDALALGSGYVASWAAGLGEANRRAVTYEVGMRNAGVSLALAFNHFAGIGGVAVIAAWWGVWHIVSGLPLALIWRRYPPKS
jgi:BASS family bile acid:Na+ symporter